MPTLRYAYRHIDVFTTRALEGNPLAVFPDARGLTSELMQRIAGELNLSETVFVFPPDDAAHAARLRIFTPRRELPFAGHPTVGAASVLVSTGIVTSDVFAVEENVGVIPMRSERVDGGVLTHWLTTPAITFGDTVAPEACARALGLDVADMHGGAPPQYASAGSPFLLVPLATAAAVDRAAYDPLARPAAAWPDVVGTFLFCPAHEPLFGERAVYSRMFAPESGISEDPATGGATGPLAAYLLKYGLLALDGGSVRFTSEQGTKMGRRSLLRVAVTSRAGGDVTIEIGGASVEIANGILVLDEAFTAPPA